MAWRAAEYDRYDGPRSRAPAWWPLWRATFQRGWSSKWIRLLTLGAFLPTLVMAVVFYVRYQVLPGLGHLSDALDAYDVNPQWYLVLMQIQTYGWLLPMAVLLGSDLLAGDLKSNALEAYLSRPLSVTGYLLGRTVAFTAYLLVALFIPLLAIWCVDMAMAPDGHGAVVGSVPLGLAASCTFMALTVALMVQAIASLTASGMWTAMIFAGYFMVSSALGGGIAAATDIAAFKAIAFWESGWVIADRLLGAGQWTERHPTFGTALGMYLGLAGLSLTVFVARVRRGGRIG